MLVALNQRWFDAGPASSQHRLNVLLSILNLCVEYTGPSCCPLAGFIPRTKPPCSNYLHDPFYYCLQIQINIRSRATAGLGSLSAHEWSMDDAAGAVASQKWVQMQQRFEKLEAAEAPRVTTSHTVAGSETDKDTSVSEPRDQTLPQRKVQSAGSEWHKANFSHDGIPCNKQEAPAAPCVLSDAAVVEQAVCEDIVGDTAGQNITTQPRKVQATGIKWHRPKPIFKPNKS